MHASELRRLADFGIVPQPYAEMLPEGWRENPSMAMDELRATLPSFVFDAAPSMVSAQNVGIPAYLANLLDPQMVRVLVTPMKAAQIYGEVKKGDWTTITAQFPMVESLGEVAPYGDYSNAGSVGSNYNWVPRQSYHVQTVTQYGDRETEMFGLAQINYVSDLNYSSALVLNKFQNKSYFYGIAGLQNYGGLNDSSLSSPISPSTKLATGVLWSAAQAFEIFNDILLLYQQLQKQLYGYELDRDTPMTLALSPIMEPNLGKVTEYTLASVRVAIKENWPNLKIITAPEYTTAAGELMQLIVDEIDGVKSVYSAFTEKLRSGRIIPDLSSYRQKKIGGTWGTVIRRPLAVASMLGIG